MPRAKRIERRHRFTVEEARERIQALTAYWQATSGLSATWVGLRATIVGKVKGFAIEAVIVVDDGAVVGTITANALAVAAGRAYVGQKLNEYLDPNTPLAVLRRT